MEKKEKNNFLNCMVDKSQYNAIFFCFVLFLPFFLIYYISIVLKRLVTPIKWINVYIGTLHG